MDYIGALAGSLIWIFLLPKFFTIVETAFVLGILNMSIAFFTLAYFFKLVTYRRTLVLLTSVVFLAIVFGLISAKGWASYSEQHLYRDRVIFSETTPFQHIVLTESRSGDISCFINGHLQFNSFDEHIYHEQLVHPAFAIAPSHRNVLILGGGDGLALREVLKYPGVQSVTLCDIDPQMTTLAKDNEILQRLNNNSLSNSRVTTLKNHALQPAGKTTLLVENQKQQRQREFAPAAEVNIINVDAAKFVEQISGLYDIIIIDFPDPNNVDLSKLYSNVFYHHVYSKLAADGILVQQSTSPVHAKEVFLLIGRTMQDAGLNVLPFHDNVPSFGEWGWWIGGRSERYSHETLRERIRTTSQLPVDTRYLTPAVLRSSFEFGKFQLESEYSDINTISNGLAFSRYVQAWNIN